MFIYCSKNLLPLQTNQKKPLHATKGLYYWNRDDFLNWE